MLVVFFGKIFDTMENLLSDLHNLSHSSGLFLRFRSFFSGIAFRPQGCGNGHNGVHEDDTAQAVDDGAEEIDVAGHLQVGTGPNAAKVAKTDVGRTPKKINF